MKKKKFFTVLVSGMLAFTASIPAAAQEAPDTAEENTQTDSETTLSVSSTETDSEENTAEADLPETAARFAKDLLSGSYEKLKTDYTYDPAMLPVIESGQIAQIIEPNVKASGALLAQKEGFISSVSGGYTNVDIPCLFAVQPWNLTVTFTSSGEIAGLHISLYSEGLPDAPADVQESELALDIGNERTLPGTLTVPANADSYDAVIFVHGSGASDRDETIGSIRPFQDLAWGLAKAGIASYRYDKISYVYGKELADDTDFTVYDETVNDAAAAIRLLRSQPGVRSVFVLGHSQGGMMMGAIAQDGAPDGCILLAAPTESYAAMLRRQIDFLTGLEEPSPENAAVYDALKELADALDQADTLPEDFTAAGLHAAYIKSIAEYDAVEAMKPVSVPVLVLQGEEDYQVTMDSFRTWQDTFGENENWSFTSFSGLTHLFTEGKLENGPDAYAGNKHIPQEVITRIAEFISENTVS